MPVPSAIPPPGQPPGTGLWSRAVQCLHRRSAAPARLSRAEQTRALLAVLEEAVAVQRPADAAVAACGVPEGASGQAAQECGRAGSQVYRLQAWLRQVPVTDPDLAVLRARAGRLLAYDQWMLRQAMDLAFTVHPDARIEAARLQLNGLGRPADELRRLRDALRQAAPGPAARRPAGEGGRV